MLGVDANHAHHSGALDNLALVTNLLNRCPNFHGVISVVLSIHGPGRGVDWSPHEGAQKLTYAQRREGEVYQWYLGLGKGAGRFCSQG